MNNYTPTLGFKVDAARIRGLIQDKTLYKIGILIEGFYYCQQSLSLPPTQILLSDLQAELKSYYVNLTIKQLVKYLMQLGSIQYVTDEVCVPMFAFFSVKQTKDVWECWLNFNPYF